ncbi:MAG: tRNA-(ms[2]io[6]A)-hydroxylase [Pseudomonadota bacterium]|nr:tRNA-(ms[2]io[6]A)-hydroxylase [Pseudomonadota bacterium]
MTPLAIAHYLRVPTPEVWIKSALLNVELLLIDHANCEKKAASTALSLLYRYVEKSRLLQQLSRLAREELRHFEQVARTIEKRSIVYRHVSASRYASTLNRMVRSHEPERLVDTLLVASIIEARSCERFALLADVVDTPLADLYRSLLDSERRHFNEYQRLALEYGDERDISARIEVIIETENDLITSADHEFRFHSGLPVDLDIESKTSK